MILLLGDVMYETLDVFGLFLVLPHVLSPGNLCALFDGEINLFQLNSIQKFMLTHSLSFEVRSHISA